MASGSLRFDRFVIDPQDRQLTRDDEPVELSSRYLDALVLLVREEGRLVSKARFMDEVWTGVPVTDEALTQCIRTLRRQLGDDAAKPRFIETVPKHGYRFIAPVEPANAPQPAPIERLRSSWRQFLFLGAAGVAGGAIAGVLGGLFYGFAAASEPLAPGTGATSVLLVLLAMTVLVATIGAAGVSFGIAAAWIASQPFGRWSIAGGAVGGLLIGAFVKLLGLDAFDLLFGRSPGDITGAAEGAILGGAVGAGAWLAAHGAAPLSLRRAFISAALTGAAAGMLIALLGGRLMGGSLDLLARTFPGSRLGLGQLGALFGEASFGPITQVVTGAFEGALFAGCVVGAMVIARRNLTGGS
jgi:DNA-binding winged helix-turn-helix (wHTH) protein